MRNSVVALGCALSIFSASATRADCLPAYQAEIEKRQANIEKFRHTKHQIVLWTGVGVGVPVGIAGGLLFLAITDGATVPAAAFSGLIFGGIAGGAAAGAVYVPLELVELIKRAGVLPYIHAAELIREARDFDHEGKLLKRLLKQLKRSHPGMDMDDLIGAINAANAQDAFCQGKLFKPGSIKRYLRGEPMLNQKHGPATDRPVAPLG